ncbi:UEV domain-containing protein [Gautieria morchelliformis]|nr:UEV domain-containing protein [Gautieria morchelliformis]
MADSVSLTQKWLRLNIQPYSHKDFVYSHVDAVLASYQTLRPKTDVYTFDDGRSQLLLCVHGLLPIQYRRASYNIPVAVWLTHQYPTEPPLVYVVPTSDMLVKAAKFVDVSGRCEPAYIHAWQKKSEGCNLQALMEVLTEQFSRDPPVYAKPQTPSPSRHTPSPANADYSSRPPPHPPGPSSPGRRPTPPPRPIPVSDPTFPPQTRSPPLAAPHYSHAPQNVYHPPRSATPSAASPAPPIYSTPPPHAPSPSHGHIRSASATHYSPLSSQGPSHRYSHPEPIPPQPWSVPLGRIPMQSTMPPPPPPPPPSIQQPSIPAHIPLPGRYPPPSAHSSMPPVPPPARNYLDEDVEDTPPVHPPPSTAPPRPPNPEVLRLHAQVHAKFTSEFTALERALATDMQRLQTAQADLLAGEPAIRDEMARLEAVRDVCCVVGDRLRATVNSVEVNLHELRRKGDPEVDELICSTTIVYNQLINLTAEDNAIEDTIYHLHRALNAGRIDLDKFLRTTRALAEEQFMKRALAEKVVSSIPMGAWS